MTAHPTAAWTIQQFRAVITGEAVHRVLHDRETAAHLAAQPKKDRNVVEMPGRAAAASR